MGWCGPGVALLRRLFPAEGDLGGEAGEEDPLPVGEVEAALALAVVADPGGERHGVEQPLHRDRLGLLARVGGELLAGARVPAAGGEVGLFGTELEEADLPEDLAGRRVRYQAYSTASGSRARAARSARGSRRDAGRAAPAAGRRGGGRYLPGSCHPGTRWLRSAGARPSAPCAAPGRRSSRCRPSRRPRSAWR